ncbi:hypothetical protein PsorP6_002071 [Peronosclerospora sorghi]|uniref:Uncharacterized protein n=1 Tax=Peronosclerospora sorghi TaxID=230839 RepID=A0ACC0WWR4_9STRA|nr:hypothetical protein PsorP6_002071 [Peronosclerospora sorghi]
MHRLGLRWTPVRRLSYRRSAPHSGGQDNSSFFTLLGLAGVIGGIAYVYYDPDVLPTSVKRWQPIQEPEGRGMSPEEYEQWRAKQTAFPINTIAKKEDEEKSKSLKLNEEEKFEPPQLNDDIPIPHGDVSREKMKASLEKLLTEARENEAAFIAELKSSGVPVSVDDRQMV